MTPDEVDEGIALVRDWLDDYPEGTVIALFEARAWEVKGYADWDALCAAEFPRKVQLPRPERRELVGRMREAGMSMPAIASATGVSVGTVHGDLSTLKGRESLPDTVTGLDGRTRPAHVTTTTRTAQATKVEQVVDLATGEILNEDLTAEQWEAEQAPTVADYLADDPSIADARYRANVSKVLSQVAVLPKYDPTRVADLLDDDGWYALDLVLSSLHDWHQSIAKRRRPLTLIGGSK